MLSARTITNPSTRRVLIADDDEMVVDLLAALLREDGTEVVRAGSGPEALERLDDAAVDLLLTDAIMPGFNGFDLIRRARSRRPGLQAVMLTGYPVEDHIRLIRDAGVRLVATKPFECVEMRRILAHAIDPGSAFGLEAYLAPDAEIRTVSVTSLGVYGSVAQAIEADAQECAVNPTHARLLAEELILNALYHAPRNDDGTPRNPFLADVTLDARDAPKLRFGRDARYFAISVSDPHGTLRAESVVDSLATAVAGADGGRSRGRGLSLIRGLANRIVVNLEAGRRTELVGLFFLANQPRTHKPLLINEVTE